MKRLWIVLCLLMIWTTIGRVSGAETSGVSEKYAKTGEIEIIKDPLQPFNRAMFVFNDKAYHYVLRPLHIGYSAIVPEKARTGINNCFENIRTPVRFFNCLFQGKIIGAGTEIARLVINSTVGIGGFWDPSTKLFHIKKEERDFGQTLGKGKMGRGPYIVWPLLGPSNLRDTFGLLGDTALNPESWICPRFLTLPETAGTYAGETVNDGSDKGKTYEEITKPAIDPYIALQDAYTKNREKKMRE